MPPRLLSAVAGVAVLAMLAAGYGLIQGGAPRAVAGADPQAGRLALVAPVLARQKDVHLSFPASFPPAIIPAQAVVSTVEKNEPPGTRVLDVRVAYVSGSVPSLTGLLWVVSIAPPQTRVEADNHHDNYVLDFFDAQAGQGLRRLYGYDPSLPDLPVPEAGAPTPAATDATSAAPARP